MVKRMKELLKDEEGATMVEYALMLALIAVACILIIQGLGTKVGNTFTECAEQMP